MAMMLGHWTVVRVSRPVAGMPLVRREPPPTSSDLVALILSVARSLCGERGSLVGAGQERGKLFRVYRQGKLSGWAGVVVGGTGSVSKQINLLKLQKAISGAKEKVCTKEEEGPGSFGSVA
jgi:hypothetical protein